MRLEVGLIDRTPEQWGIVAECFDEFTNGSYVTKEDPDHPGTQLLVHPKGELDGFVLEVTGNVDALEHEVDVWATAVDYEAVFTRVE